MCSKYKPSNDNNNNTRGGGDTPFFINSFVGEPDRRRDGAKAARGCGRPPRRGHQTRRGHLPPAPAGVARAKSARRLLSFSGGRRAGAADRPFTAFALVCFDD